MMSLNRKNRFRLGFSSLVARSKSRPLARSRPRGVEVLESRELLSTLSLTNHDHAGAGLHQQAIVASNASTHHQKTRVRDLAASVSYYNSNAVSIQPVKLWQGIRAANLPNRYLISGTTDPYGLIFMGTIKGHGRAYKVEFPASATTSVYGPDNLASHKIRLVGSYTNPISAADGVLVDGFLYQGTVGDLNSAGAYRTIDYPGATINFVHSSMGGFAVGNYDIPIRTGILGPAQDYIYNVATSSFVTNIVYPGSVSDTAYGIWHNGGTSYTIVGGYSDLNVNNMNDQNTPIGQAYIVDYNSATGQFTHWTSFSYPLGQAGVSYFTHFEGISSVKSGVYTLAADSVPIGSNSAAQGAFVTVKRNPNGTFGPGKWVNLNYPNFNGLTSSNAVSGNQVVGIAIGSSGELSYEATVKG